MFPSLYPDADAQKMLNEWKPAAGHPLVQIETVSTKQTVATVSGD
jgi:hypothetical protein